VHFRDGIAEGRAVDLHDFLAAFRKPGAELGLDLESAVSIGLGVVLPPEATFGTFVGALLFWIMGRRHPERAAMSSGSRAWSRPAPD
jgi:hypothetical protein